MSVAKREEEYLRLLRQRPHTVKELSEILYISQPTVRRDVAWLREKELLVSLRGLVKLKPRYADQRIPLFVRDMESGEAKSAIAKKAAQLVFDGAVIMLDASTTAYHVLREIKDYKNLLLITNGAKTALASTSYGIKTICTGGEMTPESLSYVGADAERTLRCYNADFAFFSCRGISEDGLITDNSISENSIRQIMISCAKKKYLLCDRTKFGKVFLNTLCRKNQLDGVITDE